ncbi:Probable RNA 3'-terminal phosphate cyclase-like protein [Seminavis robusta]|uniref:Probable RNA 3'-terminal phosphate cyclase-like protein n=1 Tax=Seminavis robusta TaxID=568900 RepID=A0A9N8EQG4_9STRA|nr:Probable RNA 3'-terminal phosphate cyclase-like protein [Seminavis robusta]|eukprot:Sro1551_g281780.1 Probable RNA 3'-terminal phosphate cyclase-like protein (403) ;mRNA; f:19810-21132
MSSNSPKKMKKQSQTLIFEDGAVQFRQRLAVSLLSTKPILIRNIRANDLESPGLREYEASFLRLLDAMTNGTKIEINSTGTQLRFKPGVLLGGRLEHTCPVGGDGDDDDNDDNTARSIGWFLEGILPLAPFGKESLSLQLTGITDGTSDLDPSPDYLQASAVPLLQHFGLGIVSDFEDPMLAQTGPYIKVPRRGAAPLGGGLVEFFCPRIKELKPIDLMDPGKVKRIRGSSISCKIVSSSMTTRSAYAAKGLLQRLLPDIWIVTDVHTIKKTKCGPSPALSMVLSAQSTNGMVLTAETCFRKQQELPEDVGKRAAAMLLEEVRRGGVVDTTCQSTALLLMCVTPEDVSRIRLGTLTQYTVESLRLFKRAFGVEFKVKPDEETKTVALSCLGTGYRNMARAST